jgi:hypothetical protein
VAEDARGADLWLCAGEALWRAPLAIVRRLVQVVPPGARLAIDRKLTLTDILQQIVAWIASPTGQGISALSAMSFAVRA